MRKYSTAVILSLLIGLYAWFIFVAFQYPFLGVDLKLNEHHQWVVNRFDFNSQFEGQLHVGDVVEEVDGKDPNELDYIAKWQTLRYSDYFIISRNGVNYTFHKYGANWTLNDLQFLISAAVNLFIAWLLYAKSKPSFSGRLLSIVFLEGSSAFMSVLASIRGDMWGRIFVSIFVMLLPILFLHFLVVFFKEKGNIVIPFINIKSIKKMYVFIGLLSLFLFVQVMIILPDNILLIRYVVTILSFTFGILLNFFALTYVSIKYRKPKTFLTILTQWVWFSFLVSFFPFTILSLLPQLILNGHWWVSSYYTVWFILFFPLSFAYLILTKRLYDLDVILRRVLYTVLVSLFPSLLIVGINIVIFDHKIEMNRLVLNVLIITIILSILLYSLEYYAIRLQKLFFPRKHYLQTSLKDISQKLRSTTTFRELKDLILTDIVNTLQVFGGAIVIDRGGDIEIISEGMIDEREARRLVHSGSGEFTAYSLIEINRNEEYISYLVMTEKKTNTKLGLEDNQWLNIIISYLAVSLENIYLIRKLTLKLHQLAAEIPNEQGGEAFIWFRKSMFELQEKERFRIATDLHDTTMQDILFVKRRIEPFLQQFVPDSNEYRQTLTVLRHLELINENLRQSCFELHPYLLQRAGLIQTVRKMIELEEGMNDFEVEFVANDAADIEKMDMEAKTQVFRMIQELLNNAKKHARASRVSIQVGINHGWLYVKYEDDGIGFDMHALAKTDKLSSALNSGLGLEQMKSRILHLNGNWKLDSTQGEGVKMHITIPVKEGKTA
ncbi:sensor histidine kinase [Ferviditalea candida]|uniref:ATP-binding protein n=1 Tax=Ferviditalea candida TaxID=3108399 RepID=A0ABU5ZI73_9BACL|nr:ATP-binding protein [Paenibacillaceae bacterium T2]